MSITGTPPFEAALPTQAERIAHAKTYLRALKHKRTCNSILLKMKEIWSNFKLIENKANDLITESKKPTFTQSPANILSLNSVDSELDLFLDEMNLLYEEITKLQSLIVKDVTEKRAPPCCETSATNAQGAIIRCFRIIKALQSKLPSSVPEDFLGAILIESDGEDPPE